MAHAWNSEQWRLRQEDHPEFEVSLGYSYIVINKINHCLKLIYFLK